MFRNRWKMDPMDLKDELTAAEQEEADVSVHPAPEKFSLSDYIIAAILGVSGIIFISILSFFALHPTAWNACAEAAGLRSPLNIIPGFWRLFARLIYSITGIGAGNATIAFLGKISFGVIFAFMYLFFRGFLALFIRSKTVEYVYWRRYVARLICILASFLFTASDPIWQLCLSFTPRTLLLILTIVAAFQWIKFLTEGKVRPAYVAMVLFGLLSSETPFGFLITLMCWTGYIILRFKRQLAHIDLMDVYKLQTSKWYLTFFWALGLVVGISLNVISFAQLGGLEAANISGGDVPLAYAVEYTRTLAAAASAGGWIICGGFAIMVLVVSLMFVYRTTDIEYFLGYVEGLTLFVVGVLSYIQLFSIRALWSWNWIKSPEMVHNPYLLSLFVLFFTIGFLIALTVFSVNLFCRDPRRIAMRLSRGEEESVQIKRGSRTLKKYVFLTICVIFAIGVLPSRYQPRTNRMLSLMRVYVLETVREAGDARWLFTDGSYDAAIELEAAAKGKNLVCLPVFNGMTSRSNATLGKYLDDDEDRLSAQIGGANILSTWQRDKPGRLAESALQVGFELWRRSGGMYPATSGTLARVNMEPEVVATGVKVTRILMDNILKFYDGGEVSSYAGRQVRDLFLFMQWRLSRLARIRAEIADHADNAKVAMEESEYANKLDEKNESLQKLITNVSQASQTMMRQMTPREGLQFALVRANFQLARHYAKPILEADPDNSDANFGMGMSFFEEGQFARAEEFLARCLKRNENEPAVWNNLAVIKMKLGRFEEAKRDAQKALALIPDSIEVKDTIREIEKAIKQREEDMKLSAEERAKEAKKAAKGIRK